MGGVNVARVLLEDLGVVRAGVHHVVGLVWDGHGIEEVPVGVWCWVLWLGVRKEGKRRERTGPAAAPTQNHTHQTNPNPSNQTTPATYRLPSATMA